MYRQQIAKKLFPSSQPTPIQKKAISTPSYGSLSGTIQRATANPETLSREEWVQLDSAIGTRATKEIKSGKRTSYVPEFKGLSAKLCGDSGQVSEPIQAKQEINSYQRKEAFAESIPSALTGREAIADLTTVSQKLRSGESTIQFIDNRSEIIQLRKLQDMEKNLPQGDEHSPGYQPIPVKPQPIKRKALGKSAEIALAMGQQYGVDTKNLEFNHNSSFPGKVGAESTIQGNKIDFAPGKDTEQNIKHEVGHAIDNAKNGTPKGDKVVNGQVVDTTREKAADKIMLAQLEKKTESWHGTSVTAKNNAPVQRVITHNKRQINIGDIDLNFFKEKRLLTKIKRLASSTTEQKSLAQFLQDEDIRDTTATSLLVGNKRQRDDGDTEGTPKAKKVSRGVEVQGVSTQNPSNMEITMITTNINHFAESTDEEKKIQIGKMLTTIKNQNAFVVAVAQEINDFAPMDKMVKDKLKGELSVFRGTKYASTGGRNREYYALYTKAQYMYKHPKLYVYTRDPQGGSKSWKGLGYMKEEMEAILYGKGMREAYPKAKDMERFPPRAPMFWKLWVYRNPEGKNPYEGHGESVEKREKRDDIQKMIIMNIHTSPTGSIYQELEETKKQLDLLADRYPNRPIAAIGDYYMEKSSKRLFNKLIEGKDEKWKLSAVSMSSGGWAPTNAPDDGEGQAADLAVTSIQIRISNTDFLRVEGLKNVERGKFAQEFRETYGPDHAPIRFKGSLNGVAIYGEDKKKPGKQYPPDKQYQKYSRSEELVKK